jgi:predicted glycoside hydrolase/deacetylase ChbG (UPF0249 family)
VTTPPPKPLILCADDYAASSAISHGIVTLARAGRLTATSAMTLAPRWLRDAPALRELRGQIDVGLHLDWTSAFARTAGHGLSLIRAMLRAASSTVGGGFNRTRARVVIERQLDAFEAAWQAPPDHVDGHQHVQQFAGIREALVEALARRYPERPPWLRISRVGAGQAGLKGRIITVLGAEALTRQAARAGLPCAAALWGVYDFTGGPARYAALLDGWLARAPAGAVLMCHPADPGDPPDPLDLIAPARAWEFACLGSAAFGDALARHNVMLAHGGTVLQAPPPAP